jgi:hypothetical protein
MIIEDNYFSPNLFQYFSIHVSTFNIKKPKLLKSNEEIIKFNATQEFEPKESDSQITIELNKQNDFETCANLRKKQFQLVVHV